MHNALAVRVLKPAGMASSVTEQAARFANPNRVWPHGRIDGRVRGMGEQVVLDERQTLGDNGAPAGGLSSSAKHPAAWIPVQPDARALPLQSRHYSADVAPRLRRLSGAGASGRR